MTYTATELITRAFYLSQVVSRDLETPSESQITDGLYLLNALLQIKASDIRLIPYFSEYEFDTVQGTEKYFVPNLLYTDTTTFNIGVVRYEMKDMTRKQYFGGARVDNIQSLPFSYRVERCLGGSNIYFYFSPASQYKIKIWGKFGLTEVDFNTDLSQFYDGFYIEYLRFALAEYICTEWGTTFPDQAKEKYKEIRKKLVEISPPDLSIRKQSYFTRGPFIDWQSVNIPGWWPF